MNILNEDTRYKKENSNKVTTANIQCLEFKIHQMGINIRYNTKEQISEIENCNIIPNEREREKTLKLQ